MRAEGSRCFNDSRDVMQTHEVLMKSKNSLNQLKHYEKSTYLMYYFLTYSVHRQ